MAMIDMKKCTKHVSRVSYSNQKGAILIWLIITMVVVSITGSSMVYLTTSSTYSELFANSQARAYYLAESGGMYAIPQIKADPTVALDGTYTLGSSGKFTLAIDNSAVAYAVLTSMGVVNKDSWLESEKSLSYRIIKPYEDPFDDLGDWSTGGSSKAQIRNNVDGDNALNIKDDEVVIGFNWAGNPGLPQFDEMRDLNGGYLSYELQIKSKSDFNGNKGDHYMDGLSFRLDIGTGASDLSDDTSYGVSFFWSEDEVSTPSWVGELDINFLALQSEIADLDTTKGRDIYLVLWRKAPSTAYVLLDSKLMGTYREDVNLIDPDTSDPYGVVVVGGNSFIDMGYGAVGVDVDGVGHTDWTSIMVRVHEVDDGSGGRLDHIKAYVENPTNYPRSTTSSPNPISWEDTLWDDNSNKVIPSAGTPTDFFIPSSPITAVIYDTPGATRAEIGIHGFSDSSGANDQYFDDFALRFVSDESDPFSGVTQN